MRVEDVIDFQTVHSGDIGDIGDIVVIVVVVIVVVVVVVVGIRADDDKSFLDSSDRPIYCSAARVLQNHNRSSAIEFWLL